MNRLRFCRPTALWSLLALTFALTLTACDSNGGGNDEREAVTGTYTVSQLTLDPEGELINPIDVLGRASDITFIFAPEDGEFSLRYSFRNDDDETIPRLAGGSYGVDGESVTINFDGQDSGKREQLLLPDTFSLQMSGTQITGEVNVEDVNLGAYSMQDYGNQVIDEGVLQITLGQGGAGQ